MRLKYQIAGTRDEDTQLQFMLEINYRTAMKNKSLRKQQVFVAIQLADTQETIAFSQWNHVNVNHNSADVDTRAINLEELKKSSGSLVRLG